MAANDSGDIGVMWYDRRHDPANEAFDVHFAVSTDGGLSFSTNVAITGVMSDPRSTPMIGDYNGLTAQGDKFFPLWTDLRNWDGVSNNVGDIFMARIGVVAGSQPVLVDVMGGIGAEFPAGSADTFISPKGDWLDSSQFDCDFLEFEITVSEAVDLVRDDVDFTGNPGDKPQVSGLVHQGSGIHTVMLDRALVPQEWAKITLTVQSQTSGCMGTLVMWVAHHPDNINQDGIVDDLDTDAFGNEFNGQKRPELIDLNCDGVVNISDATAYGNQWRGDGGATQAWQGTTLPPKPL